ncbi:DUF930 domain-containing protein [Rhizobium sp. LEGMi135b]
MEKVAEKRDREIRPGFVLSILLHVLFVVVFLLPLLPAPPEAKPEQSVNVELVPQQEEKQELATKENEKPDQPPKPTPKPDEKPAQQTAEAQEEPQQPQGKKSDEQPPKQSDPQGKEAAEKPPAKPDEAKADKPVEKAEKPAPKPNDPGADKPVEKAEQQPPVVDVPVPDMNGDQKNPTTIQQADTSDQRSDTPPMQPNNTAAEQQAEAQAATETVAQAQATQQADAKDQTTNAAEPPASDSTIKAPSSVPDVLATKEPSDFQVQSPQAASSDLKQQAPAEQAKNEAKDLPQIVVPAVKPPPSQQNSQDQSASSSQGNPTGGPALVTEAQPKSDATKMAVRAKKLYSDVEMARLSKSNYDAWKKMPRRERVSYLCRSEALAQFGHEFNAPNYVNSAFAPTMRSDTSVSADGVAVPTSKGWYRVAFRCQVDDAALKVTAFSYTNDGRVPKNQLERLGLPAF